MKIIEKIINLLPKNVKHYSMNNLKSVYHLFFNRWKTLFKFPELGCILSN